MANPNAPIGLKSVSGAYNGPYNGGFRAYSIPASDATALYLGDLVTEVGTGQVINGIAYTDVTRSATGDIFTGVVVGFEPVSRDSNTYRTASTQRVVYVEDDPNALWEIQEVTGGTQLTVNDIGLNANVLVAAGSNITGWSGTQLNNVGVATTATLDVKIVGFVPRADNDFGAAAKWLVRLNRHRYVNQVAGV